MMQIKRVGLTGGIASGKSTVAQIFASFGIRIVDADVLAKKVLQVDSSVQDWARSLFGKALDFSKEQNRKELSKLVFSNQKYKKELENIIHPKVRLEFLKEYEYAQNNKNYKHNYIIYDVPLLFEADAKGDVDIIISVLAKMEIREQRASEFRKTKKENFNAIVKHQVTDKERIKNSDFIIDNSGNLQELREQVSKIHNKISFGK